MPQWIPDSIFEARLKGNGITYEWRDRINLDEIDVKGSLKNNARLGDSIIQDNVIKIGCSMEAGDPIPGITLRKMVGKRLLFVVAGNHRVAATQLLELKTVGGFIIRCTDLEAELITRTDNRKTGVGQTTAETYQHVYAMHLRHQVPIATLAADFAVPKTDLQKVIRAMKLSEELEESNINTTPLSISALSALNTIRQNEDVLLRAAQLAVTYGMTATKVTDMASQIKASRSPTKSQVILDGWEQEEKKKAKTPKKKRTTPVKTKLFNLLESRSGILHLLKTGKRGKPITSVNDLQLDDVEAQKLLDDWKAVEERMKPLLQQCKQWIRQQREAAKGRKRK